ncbi:hypothetical protein HY643_03215 [Candidatus Woesearchaeota archaeon]|nr:hypothetical protein [Candidatus Woesearchaeota archaeon]
MSEDIAWFKELSNKDVGVAGGKGASLGEMYNNEFPIPPGFVITAQAYQKYITKTGIADKIYGVLKNLDVDSNEALQGAAKKVQEIILQTKMPEGLMEEIAEAYDAMNISEDVLKGANKQTLSLIRSGREPPFVAVRSSATAEDLPSISEDDHVFVKLNGKPMYCRVKELYDQVEDGTNFGLEVPSMKDNKLAWTKIGILYKHPAEGKKLYKIVTDSGREITISPNHSLIKLDKNNLAPKTSLIEELGKEDLIPVVSSLPEINSNLIELDVLDYVKGKDVANINEMVFIKNNSTNFKLQNPLPRKIRLDAHLLYFLGLYIAEGCTYKKAVILTNSKEEIRESALHFLKSVGLYKNQKINKHSIRVYCKTLTRLLEELTGKPLNMKGKGRSCKIKKIPNFVFGLSKTQIGIFLKGCYDGDGYISKNGIIEFTSTSELLIGGIAKLLELLGFTIYLRRKSGSFNVNIPPFEVEKFKELIGFTDKQKIGRLNEKIKSCKMNGIKEKTAYNLNISQALSNEIRKQIWDKQEKRFVEFHTCPKCYNKISETSKYKNKRRFLCAKCRKTFYEENTIKETKLSHIYYDEKGRFKKGANPWNKGLIKNKCSLRKIRAFLDTYNLKEDLLHYFNGDVKWERVREVKEIPYTGWVYDFTVPEVENFVAGIGGIITHNTASFAGQQATFLNVRGTTRLLDAVQKCWASLFTARAIYYRVKNNFPHEKVFIAVVIQKMVNSDKAGVIFSVNPITNNEEEIIIEAGYGLGEAIVSGSINPNQYTVDKSTLEIKDVKVNVQKWMYTRDMHFGTTVRKNLSEEDSKKQTLSDYEIKRLADLTRRIEGHYVKPQDIEFAIEGKNIYIVQSRPITTLKKPGRVQIKEERGEKKEKISFVSAKVLVEGIEASPGHASGKVRLVHGIEDLGKVEQGNILVTRMTDPDMVPTMERAAGIVTDQGGSTCFSASTKILTTKGFMTMQEAYGKLSKNETLKVLSLNPKTFKSEWKIAKNPIKREAKTCEVVVSQRGLSKQNKLRLTPDHKMLSLNNREVVEERLDEVIANNKMVCVMDFVTPNLNPHEISNPKLAYVCGAIFSDGHVQSDNRHGKVMFIQKETEEKMPFINAVKEAYYDTFEVGFTNKYLKKGKAIIRGKEFYGEASAFVSSRNLPASTLKNIQNNIIDWVLHLDEQSLKKFIAGALDGDGTFNISHESGRLHIYSGKKYFTEGLILALLRLGIFPNISMQRGKCCNIQITEKIEELLNNTKRVKGIVKEKILGTKLFSAKQIIADIIDEVNWKGKIKPYIKGNLLIDAKKVNEKILPLIKSEETKEQLLKIINADFRMHRITKTETETIEDVYNFEVEDNHTYAVFTENYTPVIVWNCHAAIVSREMGIPCIVGTITATSTLKDGQVITMDANSGKVYDGEVDLGDREAEVKKEEEGVGGKLAPPETVTEIKLVMDFPEHAEKAAETGADGVGLLRAEFMILSKKEHPAYLIKNGRREEVINNLVDGMKRICQAFKGKPVWYRTSDFRTDEYRNMKGGEEEPQEDNPMLGWHGVRRSLDQPELLKTEFEAIKRVHDMGFTNLGVMIPMVTHLDQVKRCKDMLKEFGLEPMENIDFGVMVETPAAVQIIEDICKEGIDFISFGTNDLTQFTLAIDRNNAKIQKLYSELHPAVLKQLKQVIKVCREYNVETSICGQAGSNPEMAEFLVKAGIDSISANADAINEIRHVVAKAEKKLLLKVARKDLEF